MNIEDKYINALSQTGKNKLADVLNEITRLKTASAPLRRYSVVEEWSEARGLYVIILECGHTTEAHELHKSKAYECKICKAALK